MIFKYNNLHEERYVLIKKLDYHRHRILSYVRKNKQIDGASQPYMYIGKDDVTEYEGEKPITVKMKLENEMPVGLYTEFTKKV